MSPETVEFIHHLVKNFLQENSGGEKFGAVFTHVFYALQVASDKASPQEIEDAICSVPGVKVLIYGWQTGRDAAGELWREKRFIYTQLPGDKNV
jgi:hypothetical protein